MMISMSNIHRRGFTIVELLIVIVVIAILAAITVVAYNSIQQRAYFSNYRTDISALDKAVKLYYADKGQYPGTGGAANCWTNVANGNEDIVPGLVPSYISKTPPVPNWQSGKNYYAYCWNGAYTEYKLMRLVQGGATIPQLEQDGGVAMDPVRPGRAWGLWSAGGSGL